MPQSIGQVLYISLHILMYVELLSIDLVIFNRAFGIKIELELLWLGTAGLDLGHFRKSNPSYKQGQKCC